MYLCISYKTHEETEISLKINQLAFGKKEQRVFCDAELDLHILFYMHYTTTYIIKYLTAHIIWINFWLHGVHMFHSRVRLQWSHRFVFSIQNYA
jgi:hypothetical protein